MTYLDTNQLPSEIQTILPSEAQSIFLKAYNGAEKYQLLERRRNLIAWEAIKKAGFLKTEDGIWVIGRDSINSQYKPSVEEFDTHTSFHDVVFTREAITNNIYKTKESILNAKFPPTIPIYMDHVSRLESLIARDQRVIVGWANNLCVDSTGDYPKIIGSDNIYKEYNEIIDRIKSGDLRNHSIEYRGKVSPGSGTYDNEQYTSKRDTLQITGVAIMELQKPSCTLEQGCGIFIDSLGSVTWGPEWDSEISETDEIIPESEINPDTTETEELIMDEQTNGQLDQDMISEFKKIADQVETEKVKQLSEDLATLDSKFVDSEAEIVELNGKMTKLTEERDLYMPFYKASQEQLKEKRGSITKAIMEQNKGFTEDILAKMPIEALEVTNSLMVAQAQTQDQDQQSTETAAEKVYGSIGTDSLPEGQSDEDYEAQLDAENDKFFNGE